MKRVKILKKNNWTILRLCLVLIALFGLYSFANKRNKVRAVEQVLVRFNGAGDPFVTTKDVNNLLIQSFAPSSIIDKSTLDLNRLEGEVRLNQMIKKADVYVSVDGVLVADVWQRRAIGRVINEDDSFYIDEEGVKVPLSENYSARVPLVVGEVTDLNKISSLLRVIDADAFLKKSITSISVGADQNLEMRSRNQKFKILFGDFNEVDKKFENYKAFMKFASQDTLLLEQYKTINLKFTQQVVCSK